MELFSVYEAFLYYCCLLLIARNILCFSPNKKRLIISFLVFIPLVIIAATGTNHIFNIVFSFFLIAQFLLIKLIFKGSQLRLIVYSYTLLYCINIIIISLFIPSAAPQYIYIDLIVNTATASTCIFVCLTRIKYHIQQIISWAPTYMLVLSFLILVTVTLTSVLFFGTTIALHKDVWSLFSRTVIVALLLSICVALPMFILISISSNHLKVLTANYEQQIQAQAEHYKTLAASNFETRRFKHDFKNISIAIEKLLADGKHEQALGLLQKYNNTLNSPGVFHTTFDTGNGIADALLTDKSEKASAFNAEITFNGAIPQDFLSPTDLCVILGNTLDNAIEACQKLDFQMNKTISISCNCNSGFLFLSINNPISEKVIIHDNHIATTKENKTLHGFGLYSLHSVVKQYDGEVRLSSTDDCFTVDIDLCVKKLSKHENCLPQ